MDNAPQPAFEAIHLVSFLLARFNEICKSCTLDVQQLYMLAFIQYQGAVNERGEKVFLRSDITRLLKDVYNSSDNQVSNWVSQLSSGGFLREVTLDAIQRAWFVMGRHGRKALILEAKGAEKVKMFLDHLERLR